jgi:signal transduction histidine kinase
LLSASSGADPVEAFERLGFPGLTLVLPNGSVVGRAVPTDEDLSGPRDGAAGSQAVTGGVAVYVPVLTSDGEILVVRNFVPDDDLTRNVARSWLTLGGLAIVLVGVAVGVANWLGRSMVKPVEELSSAASKLSEGHLDTRVTPSGPPELASVGAEFNHLAQRVTELLQQERETAADLSHRLRTPLTAARLNAESLPSGAMREQLLDDLAELERTVDHVITEARRPTREEREPADIAQIVGERATFWQALAEEQARSTEVFIATVEPLWCQGDEASITAAVDALIGNVFSHTDEGVQYSITLEAIDGEAVFCVQDEGPGFASDDAAARGHSGAGSTGLGLDIARRTAEASGGTFETSSSPSGGASVTIRLPIVER